MAKQTGNLKIKGTMNDMTFYKMRGMYLIRGKRQVSRKRILTDPKFIRVRENTNEFGMAVKAGKLLRDVVKSIFKEAGSRMTSTKLLQIMLRIIKLDAISTRGKRNAGIAMATPAAKKLLKGFEFNNKSQIGSILFKPYIITTVTGIIKISNLIPMNDVAAPEGATHLTLRGAYANLNFADRVNAIEYTNEENLPIDATSTTVTLTPAAVPAGTGTKLYLLQIEFFQMVNAVQYSLNNGSFNALVIGDVA
jgi:hypothetical protein